MEKVPKNKRLTREKQIKKPQETEWKFTTKAKFGWCLTNQHSICIKKSPSGLCGCDCHK